MQARVAGIIAHAALLGLPWLLTREPLALLALLAWVAASHEADAPTSGGHVPASEARRGLLLLVVLVLSLLTAAPIPPSAAAIGLLGMGSGFGLRRAAIHTLGPAFTARITTVHGRVRSGPYRWLDHPSELGLCLASLGFAVLCGSSLGSSAWLLLVVAPSVVRCRAEDRAWQAESA
jgi:protein-S-isoprenylcysteine O-methyltransferase Ste14